MSDVKNSRSNRSDKMALIYGKNVLPSGNKHLPAIPDFASSINLTIQRVP
jgi:hypothetical protein